MVAKTRDLLRPNTSRKAQILIAVWFFVLMFFALRSSFGQDIDFYNQLNPTGNPIGGDVGYSDILTPSDADFLVFTREELLSALQAAQSGQVIYIEDDAEIDLTNDQDVIIPGGVTLASGRGHYGSRGGLIYSNALYPDHTYISTFKTGGPNVRITGLRMRGPYGDVGDHHYDIIGVSNGIRGAHGYLEVDNCELWNWNKWAIDLEVAIGDHIHHNFIHHNRRSGYGYGVWVRGTGTGTPPPVDEIPLIEANLFDYSRHHIGSGSQDDSSWEARYNISMMHNVQQRFDRHGNASGAGHDTWIHHNWFQGIVDVDMNFRGPAGGTGLFYNNWSSELVETNSVIVSDWIEGEPTNIEIYDNHFGGVDNALLPTAVILANFTEGFAPLEVQFDGSGSYDLNGSIITNYRWNFGDGGKASNELTYGETPSYTFEDPGTYYVELIAFNEYGIPSPALLIPVYVYPPKFVGYALNAWIKDSYEGDKKGFYKKQILINDMVVWEDDVAGKEGWYHVNEDITEFVTPGETADLTIRVIVENTISDPENEIVEIFVHTDNVSVFGGTILEGDFESYGHKWQKSSEGLYWYKTVAAEEALTGSWSYLLGKGYKSTSNVGEYASITQSILFDIDTDSVTMGDVNASGVVSAYDAYKIIQHIVGTTEIDSSLFSVADVSGNGDISVYDASIILKYVAGNITCFPADPACTIE